MAADEGDEAGLFPKAEEAQSHGQPGQQPLPLMSPWGAGGGGGPTRAPGRWCFQLGQLTG